MQVPVIHMLNSLPSFLSQIQVACNLCKWGALVLALLATFLTITKRLNFLIRQNPRSITLLTDIDDDDDCSDTDDEDDNKTTSSMSSEFEDHDDTAKDERGEYFRMRGDGDEGFLRRRSIGDLFSLSEIANSKSVVKLWDTIGIGFGLGFGFDHSQQESVVSLYNLQQRIRPGPIIPTGKPPTTPAISCGSPAVVVSAGENESGNLALRIWDTRLRRRIPAVIAEWGPTLGVESVGDDGRYGLTVGDIRNVRSPLEM